MKTSQKNSTALRNKKLKVLAKEVGLQLLHDDIKQLTKEVRKLKERVIRLEAAPRSRLAPYVPGDLPSYIPYHSSPETTLKKTLLHNRYAVLAHRASS